MLKGSGLVAADSRASLNAAFCIYTSTSSVLATADSCGLCSRHRFECTPAAKRMANLQAILRLVVHK